MWYFRFCINVCGNFFFFLLPGTRVGRQCLQRLEGEAYHSASLAAGHPWWRGVGLPYQGNNCWRRWVEFHTLGQVCRLNLYCACGRNIFLQITATFAWNSWSHEYFFFFFLIFVLFCFFQVSFPISTNPSLGRRANRRLHRCHVDQILWGLGFDWTRSSHLFFFINIIVKEERLLGFVL